MAEEESGAAGKVATSGWAAVEAAVEVEKAEVLVAEKAEAKAEGTVETVVDSVEVAKGAVGKVMAAAVV